MLSASANKLSRLKEQAEEYAALIMEELDPEGLGYIEVNNMCFILYWGFADFEDVQEKQFNWKRVNLRNIVRK
jgi:hypothetical protein